ncbi:MAG: DMT family transporter [Oscillospiraceae bacterium]|nr:DMT family transporter [Oscillospiraceae bacterium]
MNKRETLTAHLLAAAVILVWGTTFLVSKQLVTVFTPAQVMFLRFVVAYLVLWALHPVWYFNLREEIWFLLLSLFANTLYYLAENTALQFTYASNVSILVSTAPILTALLLALFYKDEHITKQLFLGFIAAFAGVVLVVFNGTVILKLNPLGDALALASALIWAVYGVLMKHINGKHNSFLLSRKLMFYGMLTSLPILLVQNAPMNWAALVDAENLLSIGYLAIIASALCYVAWSKSTQILGVLQTNLYVYASPLATLAAAALFGMERVTPMGVAGMLLIIGGMIVSSLRSKKVP